MQPMCHSRWIVGVISSEISGVQCLSFILSENREKVIMFSALFREAWAKAISPSNITTGFRTCGIYPFTPVAIKVPEVNANQG